MNIKEHFITMKEISENHHDKEALIGGENANFSKHFGLKRVGAHYFKIPTGYRTSRPHAESLEEEFVYVISGEVDLWLNGRIKKMVPGDCIGFPIGIGVGHTFINNSSTDVELFVAGDRTKKENQYRFHLEPEMADECGSSWWNSMPEQILGSHNGLPGEFDQSLVDNSIFIFNGLNNLPADSYSYPGDDETFTNGVCLSRKFELKSIAVWLERIPVDKRTSWPHAHSVEEEFVYILEGNPTLWLNGEVETVGSEVAIDFKSGSGVAHTLINESEDEVLYLCVGECEPVEDKITYPLHPRRNEEVRLEGGLWADSARSVLNLKHDGKTINARESHLEKIDVFKKGEELVNPQMEFSINIWAMWLPEKRINDVFDSKVLIKNVSDNNLWKEMFKVRSKVEEEFGDFTKLDIELVLEKIKEHVSLNRGQWFICYHNDEIIGEVGYLQIEYKGSTYWRLQDVDILPSFRGKKLGTELLKEVILLAKDNQIKGLCLRADENDWKKDWYLRYGFDQLRSYP